MAMAIAALSSAAMPTQKELAKVQPVVNKLMGQALKDYKAKKMTAAEVGDAAMAFVDEASSEAVKFALMKGAVFYYTRAKDFERTTQTIEAIIELVPDITPKSLYEITSKAAANATKKTAPRLVEINNAAKKGTVPRNSKPLEAQPAPVQQGKTQKTQAQSPRDVCRAKMETIKIPALSFMPPKTLSDAIDFLRVASMDFGDQRIPLDRRGLNFVIVTDVDEFSFKGGLPGVIMPRLEVEDVNLYDALTLICQTVCVKFDILDENTVVVASPSFNLEKAEPDISKDKALSKKATEAMKKVKVPGLHMKPPATLTDAIAILKDFDRKYSYMPHIDAEQVGKDGNLKSSVWVSAGNITLYDALRYICLSSSSRFGFSRERIISIADAKFLKLIGVKSLPLPPDLMN